MRSRRSICLLGAATALCAAAPAAAVKPVSKPSWLTKVLITEYYPAPESWFVGKRVPMPGLNRPARVDWLYSAQGISMEGDGIGTDGQRYHIDGLGQGGWITAAGKKARFGIGGDVAPFWRQAPSWRNSAGAVTFPLETGGWSAGLPKREIANRGITFAAGPSRPLRYLRSVASDPRLIPLGSLVFLPDYAPPGDPAKGWMYAEDTGGAIIGRHLDVYRRPPSSSRRGGQVLRDRRVFVVPRQYVAAYLRENPPTRSATLVRGLPAVPRTLLRRPPLMAPR